MYIYLDVKKVAGAIGSKTFVQSSNRIQTIIPTRDSMRNLRCSKNSLHRGPIEDITLPFRGKGESYKLQYIYNSLLLVQFLEYLSPKPSRGLNPIDPLDLTRIQDIIPTKVWYPFTSVHFHWVNMKA